MGIADERPFKYAPVGASRVGIARLEGESLVARVFRTFLRGTMPRSSINDRFRPGRAFVQDSAACLVHQLPERCALASLLRRSCIDRFDCTFPSTTPPFLFLYSDDWSRRSSFFYFDLSTAAGRSSKNVLKTSVSIAVQ